MKRQRGLGVAVFLIVLSLGALAALMGSLNAASQGVARAAVTESALAQAKTALIGRAARDENRPGSLPCPDVDGDGSAETLAGEHCPAYVGFLPWRTLGLTDLRDGSGARLWYVQSRTFRDDDSAEPINNDRRGDIVLQSATGATLVSDLVAMVIAPERVVAPGGVAQSRPSTDPAQYLEFQGFAPAGPTFAYRQLAESNDAIATLSHRDLFSVVDQTVFERIERTFVPKMQALAATWGRYPFAAPFNPANVGLVSGQTGVYEGSPPFARASVSTAFWLSPSASQTGGPGTVSGTPSCLVGPNVPAGLPDDKYVKCDINHTGQVDFRIDVIARRAGRSFHDVTWSVLSGPALAAASWNGYNWGNPTASSAYVRFAGTTAAATGTTSVRLRLELANWAHPAGTPEDTDWILRNGWHRQLYYAVAPAYAFDGSGSCMWGSCLTIRGAPTLSNKQAVVVLAGRQLNGTTRSTALADYFENDNQNPFDGYLFRSSLHMPALRATNVTRSVATVTVTAPGHGLVTSSRVRVRGANESAYNGDWTVASTPDANTFTYELPAGSTPSSPATGAITFRTTPHELLWPTAVTRSGNVVTVTFPFDHGLSVGSRVRLQGATNSAYNGEWTIASVSGPSFTYALPSGATPLSPATGRIAAQPLANDRVAVLAP
jgi:hypothetical protein